MEVFEDMSLGPSSATSPFQPLSPSSTNTHTQPLSALHPFSSNTVQQWNTRKEMPGGLILFCSPGNLGIYG